jgi:hypothetical protein
MGYVDIKHTVWIRMYVGDDDVAEFLKDPSSASADNLSDKAEEIEWLDETSERVEPVDNSDTASRWITPTRQRWRSTRGPASWSGTTWTRRPKGTRN